MQILERGRRVIRTEAKAVADLADRLDQSFEQAVQIILNCEGRVITTGIGKAGAIAQKLAATFSSTGSPALYLHPAEGVHGDLGVVTGEDVVVALSYSGESDEILRLLPTIRRIGPTLIAIAGVRESSLAKVAQVILDVSVAEEACPLGLAPTASTAAMLAMGDALAMAAMEARGFTRDDFARSHPAGALGRRLTLRVSDVMRIGEQIAQVSTDARMLDAIGAITKAGAGAACVVDESGKLVGILTDGDFRRAALHNRDALEQPVMEYITRKPIVIEGDPLAAEALAILEESPRKVGEIPVLDQDGRPVGVVMLKDLVRAGIV